MQYLIKSWLSVMLFSSCIFMLWQPNNSTAQSLQNTVPPQPPKKQSLPLTLCVEFRSRASLQKDPLTGNIRVLLPTFQSVLQQFQLSDSNVVAFYPTFNDADTIIHHPSGYSYRAPDYGSMVKITLPNESQKDSIISALKTLIEIFSIKEIPRPTPFDE